MFRGNAAARVDEKGRLKLPSRFKGVIPDSFGRRFFVTSLTGDCVWVYPIDAWREVEKRLDAAPSTNASIRKYRRNVNFFGQEAEMDSADRILLPQLLRERAKTTGDVFIVGYGDHLEIWNRQAFETTMESSGINDDDFETFARYNI